MCRNIVEYVNVKSYFVRLLHLETNHYGEKHNYVKDKIYDIPHSCGQDKQY